MFKFLVSFAGFGEGRHPVANKFKKDLQNVLHDGATTATTAEKRTKATELIKTTLLELVPPKAFEEARCTGTGCFIDILQACAEQLDGKMLFESDLKANAGKGLYVSDDGGYLQKKCKINGKEVIKNTVSVEELIGYFQKWISLYAETFDKNPIDTMDDAVAIVSASGVYISARWMIRTFIWDWDAYKAGHFGQPQDGDYHENHIKWLLEQSIESIDYRRGEGFNLPGKDKNDGLETALYHSVATNHNLSASVKQLSKLVDVNEEQGAAIKTKAGPAEQVPTKAVTPVTPVSYFDEVQDWREGHYQALVRL